MNILQLTGQDSTHIHWLEQTSGSITSGSTNSTGIHHDMVSAWSAMVSAANTDGITLSIASAFRDFDRQLAIWNKKFTGLLPIKDENHQTININNLSELEKIHAILRYSALPGASRHHWGCDIDVYSKNLLPENQSLQLESWEYEENGPFATLSNWLANNAPSFGFYFPYDKYRGGIAAEPWHLSYAPLSQKFQQQLSVEALKKILSTADIQGKQCIINNIDEIYQQYIINIGTFPTANINTHNSELF